MAVMGPLSAAVLCSILGGDVGDGSWIKRLPLSARLCVAAPGEDPDDLFLAGVAVGLVGGAGVVPGHAHADVLGAVGGGADDDFASPPGDLAKGNFFDVKH